MQFFMKQDYRTVDKDFSDICLNTNFYRVDPKLRGDKVQIRYDPFSDMGKIWIYSIKDEYLGQGTLYHREIGDQKTKLKNNYIPVVDTKT